MSILAAYPCQDFLAGDETRHGWLLQWHLTEADTSAPLRSITTGACGPLVPQKYKALETFR